VSSGGVRLKREGEKEHFSTTKNLFSDRKVDASGRAESISHQEKIHLALPIHRG